MMKTLLIVLSCVCLVNVSFAQPVGSNCALSISDLNKFDFASTKTACATTTDSFCNTCVCSLAANLVKGLNATGLLRTTMAASLVQDSQVTVNEATSVLIRDCTDVIGERILRTNVMTMNTLVKLDACDIKAVNLQCIKDMQLTGLLPKGLTTTPKTATTPTAASRVGIPADVATAVNKSMGAVESGNINGTSNSTNAAVRLRSGLPMVLLPLVLVVTLL